MLLPVGAYLYAVYAWLSCGVCLVVALVAACGIAAVLVVCWAVQLLAFWLWCLFVLLPSANVECL